MTREEWCRRFVEAVEETARIAAVPPPCEIPWREYAEEFAANVWGDEGGNNPEEVARAEVMIWDTREDAP